MKILLFVRHGRLTTSVGGAEKVYAEFANEFTRRGYEVGAAYDAPGDAPFVFPVDSRVRLFNLRTSSRRAPAFVAAKIWREITRPLRKTFLAPLFPDFIPALKRKSLKAQIDATLSRFRPDVVVLFAPDDAQAFFHRRPRVDFATVQMSHGSPDWFLNELPLDELRALLNRCDVVQTLLPSFAPPLQAVCAPPVVSIPNVVPRFAESVDVDERERAGSPRIVFPARLDMLQKRQILAIEAFAKIADACPDWTLHFYGDEDGGDKYRTRLQARIAELRLNDRVFLRPSTPDIKAELLKSDVLAFPSSFEGFSLALTEAQSLGLPAVGFADAPSVNELIIDGENGFLATDVDDFAQKLKALIDSKELRRRFGANAKKAVEKYEASKVWDAWETLLRETVEKKRARNAA